MEFNEIKKKLITFLEENKNVPSNAIKDDLLFSKQVNDNTDGISIYIPHLAILDSQINQLLCIFIIDDGQNRIFEKFIKFHLESINNIINVPITIYLATSKNNNLNLFEVSDGGRLNNLENNNFPDYKTMQKNLIVLQGKAMNQIKELNSKLKKIQEKNTKKETFLVKFFSVIITGMSILSILLYLLESKKSEKIDILKEMYPQDIMIKDFNAMTRGLDSAFNELLNIKQQVELKKKSKRYLFYRYHFNICRI